MWPSSSVVYLKCAVWVCGTPVSSGFYSYLLLLRSGAHHSVPPTLEDYSWNKNSAKPKPTGTFQEVPVQHCWLALETCSLKRQNLDHFTPSPLGDLVPALVIWLSECAVLSSLAMFMLSWHYSLKEKPAEPEQMRCHCRMLETGGLWVWAVPCWPAILLEKVTVGGGVETLAWYKNISVLSRSLSVQWSFGLTLKFCYHGNTYVFHCL